MKKNFRRLAGVLSALLSTLMITVLLGACSGSKGLEGDWIITKSSGSISSDSSFRISGSQYIPSESCQYAFQINERVFSISTPSDLRGGCQRIDRQWDFEQPNDDELVFRRGDSEHRYRRKGTASKLAGLSGDDLTNHLTSKNFATGRNLSFGSSSSVSFVNGEPSNGYQTDGVRCSIVLEQASYSNIPAGTSLRLSSLYSSSYDVNGNIEIYLSSGTVRGRFSCYGGGYGHSITGDDIQNAVGSCINFN